MSWPEEKWLVTDQKLYSVDESSSPFYPLFETRKLPCCGMRHFHLCLGHLARKANPLLLVFHDQNRG